ncbi:MAG: DegT/DnrJ/EryC1/StrS family aminotransferase, partial [Candidatus Wallbacteria bacterium]|nr:DegT/DnrJ/EryC1/StrS family aminotransferase [Candidatus Wallbacteria bacterium]
MITAVPFLGLDRQYRALEQRIDAGLKKVLTSGHFILGPEVEELERGLAMFLGVRHVIGVASGSDALLLGMMALGIGPDDEVLTTTYSFFATGSCVARL